MTARPAFLKSRAAAALALAFLATGADARPVLRASVTVGADLVTIGDFFDDAGALADRAIFRAPDLGTTGTVPAWRVIAEARAAGLTDATEGNLVEISVTRSAREIGAGEIQRLVGAAVARQMNVAGVDSLQITFDAPLEPRLADQRSATPIRVASISLLPGQDRFEALLLLDRGGSQDRIRLRGAAVEVVDILTLARPVVRGEVVTADDLVVDRVPKRQAGAVRPIAPEEIAGLAARRQLRAGQPIVASDFTKPVLVQRGETVAIVFESPGLILTARGQALEPGALGQTVSVLNQQSKRSVIGVVTGQGRVTIGGRTPVASLAGGPKP